jgi:hypothetical protein
MSEQRADGLLPVAEAVNAEVPWLWWARTGNCRLAGMSAPPEGFPLSFLQAAPALDRQAAQAMVARLYPAHRIARTGDGTLSDDASPPGHHVYAGCLPGLAIVCTTDAAPGRPSRLPRRFLDEAAGRIVYLHAMHSAVDWFAYAIWAGDGTLRRALSLSPGSGIIENTGTPLGFEAPFWAGQHPARDPGSAGQPYPLPFHPLELADDALRALFGFTYEGICHHDDPDLENIVLVGFTVHPVTA